MSLSADLSKIQKAATSTFAQVERTDLALYHTLAEIYLLWRKGREQDIGWFEKQYAGAGIRFKKFENRENFNPLLRLVFGKDKLNNVTSSHWAAAITALDAEFVEEKSFYEGQLKGPAVSLAQWMQEQGGMLKVAGRREDEFEDIGDEIAAKAAAKKLKKKSLKRKDKRTEAEKIKDALRVLKDNDAKGVAQLPLPVAAAEGNLLVAIARKGADGKIEILATTNDRETLSQTALKTAVLDTSDAPCNLRVMADAIACHSVPAELNDLRNKLRETRTFAYEDGDIVRDKTPRLVIRPKHGDILVSEARAEASVVTHVIPSSPLIARGKDAILLGSDRHWIETTLRNEKLLGYFRSTHDWALKRGDKKKYTASHVLPLKNAITGDERNLYFYKTEYIADTEAGPTVLKRYAQADYDSRNFKEDWKFEFDESYVQEIAADFTSDWITDRKKFMLKKEHNKVMNITLQKKGWHIGFDFRDGKKNATRGVSFGWKGRGQALVHKSNQPAIMLRTRDLLYLIDGLQGIDIDGKITASGNSEIMRLSFKTPLAEFTTYAPACDGKGELVKNGFYEYVE